MSLQIPMQLETPPRAKKRKLSSDSASKWTDHQIEMLIAMWKEPDVLEAIRQPKPVYVLLANRLNDVWGNIECPDRHIWDADMIKNKIKNLRQQYIEIVEELSKQPEIHEQQDREENMAILSSWPYFGDLHDIITILPSKPKPQESQSPSRSGGEDEDTAVFPVSLVTAPSISDANLMTNQPEDMVHHVKLEKVNDRQPVRKLGHQNYQDDEDEEEDEEDEEEEGGLSKSQGHSHGRAPAWTDEEIRMLVEIWQEPEIANAIAIPTTRYKEVYQEVTDRINRIYKTHYRESIQVKHRIKYMKMTHKKLSDRAKQDPSFDPTREMLCYDEIGEIVSRKVSLPAPKEPEVKDKERPVVKKASSKAQHQRLMTWTDNEIRMLLSIWKEPMVAEKIAAKNNEVYRDIAIRLNDIWGMIGRKVDAKQVKQKVLILKKSYYRQTYESKDAAKGGGDSGVVKQTNPALRWPYYNDVDEILRRVPESQTESDVVEEELEEEDTSPREKRTNYPKNRAKNWTTKEVRHLLSIWKEPKIAHKVGEVTTKPKRVFWVIANRINKYWGDSKEHRNENQVKFKVKDLKLTYKNLTIEIENKQPDDPNPAESWPFYDEVHEILSQDFTGMTFSDLEDEGLDGDGYNRKPKNERAPRICWEEDHIKLLLSIWKEPYICAGVGEPTTRYKAIYEDITERLDGLSGMVYTVKQVRDKVKELRATYKKTLKKMEEGREDREEPWPHFDDVREILTLEQSLLAEAAAGRGKKETARERIMRKRKQRQRAVWRHREIKVLLSICKDPDIHTQLFEVTTRHKLVYQTIADHINKKLGIQRSEKQVRDKINEMKINYRSMAAKMGSAESSSRKSESTNEGDEDDDDSDDNDGHWSYFKDMDDIMTREVSTSRPVTSTPKKQIVSSVHTRKKKKGNQSSDRKQKKDGGDVEQEQSSSVMDASMGSSDWGLNTFYVVAGKRSRASNWTNEEMQHLLSIWKKPNISSRIANITTRPKGVYREVADLYNEGDGDLAPRSILQIRTKIQDMKEMYHRVCNRVQELQEFGDGSQLDPSSIWCFYQDVHDILTRDEALSALLTPVPITGDDDGDEESSDDDDDDDNDSDWSATDGKEDWKGTRPTRHKASTHHQNRKVWSEKETRVFLSIWKKPVVMNAIICNESNVYQTIAKKMNAALKGTAYVKRDSFEMKMKMTSLKRRYNAVVLEGGNTRRWCYFKDMQDIMSQLPSEPEPKYTREAPSAHGRKSPTRKRNANWSDREVRKLISIWKEPNVWKAINDPANGNGHSKKKIYQVIADRINRSGVGEQRRDEEQVRVRVKTMKRMYQQMVLKAKQPGEESTEAELADQWIHYKAMDEIMRREPGSIKVEDVSMESEPEDEDGDETWEMEMDDSMEAELGDTKVRHKRCVWRDANTQALLSIWREPAIARQIAAKSTRQKPVYKEIQNRVHSMCGALYTVRQIRDKTKEMKQTYRKIAKLKEDVANNVAKKVDPHLMAWPYYDDIHDILEEDERKLQSPRSASANKQKQPNTYIHFNIFERFVIP
ncbi:uncharacterized protein [Amphiura filiformis]|uniref:uncharacterized protein n=1 Tax=Amphiura filiformis TaxID=82378 RepID=UPI003B20BC1C